jgi:hypothetical protein
MAGKTNARCSALARALAEPLPGTAPVGDRLVCVEQLGAWPRTVDRHPDPAVAGLVERARAAGRKLLLIRRPGRRPPPDSPRTVLLADTGPGAVRVGRLVVDGPSELASVPLDDARAGEPVTRPLLLVCTHGTRDLCCAVDGLALARGLAETEADGVWECSHLGGHRFAPTALVLPTGYLYGRLDLASAIAARKAAGQGEVEHAHCRGRAAWEPAGQVAELAVRARTGLRDVDALVVARIEGSEVIVTGPGGAAWEVRVEPAPGPARPTSCGGTLERMAPLIATEVRELARAR